MVGIQQHFSGEEKELPLYTEPIIGARAFNVDVLNRLIPHTCGRVPWKPGENVSTHMKDTGTYYVDQWRDTRDHHAPDECKTCGYYGYTDRQAARDHHVQGFTQTTGIIGGYGKVAVGPWGFRAEKARIVALHVPHTVVTLGRVANLFRPWVLCILAAVSALGMIAESSDKPGITGWGVLFAVLGFVSVAAAVIVGSVTGSFHKPPITGLVSHRILRRLYPDVQFHLSRTIMLRRHGIKPVPVPDPEDDPNFWTRQP